MVGLWSCGGRLNVKVEKTNVWCKERRATESRVFRTKWLKEESPSRPRWRGGGREEEWVSDPGGTRMRWIIEPGLLHLALKIASAFGAYLTESPGELVAV